MAWLPLFVMKALSKKYPVLGMAGGIIMGRQLIFELKSNYQCCFFNFKKTHHIFWITLRYMIWIIALANWICSELNMHFIFYCFISCNKIWEKKHLSFLSTVPSLQSAYLFILKENVHEHIESADLKLK